MQTTPRRRHRSVRPIGQRIVRWYGKYGRDLPWRHDPDPYRVWVSEIMLQQTTVPVVVPYYKRFIARFPDVDALSRATDEDVLSLWSGLGYYHRAHNLLSAATVITGRYGGRVPDDRAALRALPGVGTYTAGAIMSIGYNKPHAALDGNIMRVVSRIGGIEGDPSRAATRRGVEDLVMMLMPEKKASVFNQALMDLGSMVCTPRAPLCDACPVQADCRAHSRGVIDRIPPATCSAEAVDVEMAAVAVLRNDRCLLVQREGDLMKGLWEYPLTPNAAGSGGVRTMAECLSAKLFGVVGRFRHTVTKHRMGVTVYRAAPGRRTGHRKTPAWVLSEPESRLATTTRGKFKRRWVPLDEAASGDAPIPLTAIGRKVARLLKSLHSRRSR